MKLLSNKIPMLFLVFISFYGYFVSCTHENAVLPPPATDVVVIDRGNAVLLPGTLTAGDTTQWKFDQVHSSTLWSGSYLESSGLLTGRFNAFGVNSLPASSRIVYNIPKGQPVKDTSWAFYENDPSKTFFSGYVQMNTSNTGQPGRDAGCYLGFVSAPKIVAGTQDLRDSNVAVIRTTKVEFDPASPGYLVTLVMSWQGALGQIHDTTINGKLTYIKRATVGAGTASAYDVFGLQLDFTFNCRSFGITTEEISDDVAVQCNMNFNNK